MNQQNRTEENENGDREIFICFSYGIRSFCSRKFEIKKKRKFQMPLIMFLGLKEERFGQINNFFFFSSCLYAMYVIANELYFIQPKLRLNVQFQIQLTLTHECNKW